MDDVGAKSPEEAGEAEHAAGSEVCERGLCEPLPLQQAKATDALRLKGGHGLLGALEERKGDLMTSGDESAGQVLDDLLRAPAFDGYTCQSDAQSATARRVLQDGQPSVRASYRVVEDDASPVALKGNREMPQAGEGLANVGLLVRFA